MGREISSSLLFDKWIKLEMWIQFNNAFLSILENRDNKLELLVRARIKGDIEKIFLRLKSLKIIVRIKNTEHLFQS